MVVRRNQGVDQFLVDHILPAVVLDLASRQEHVLTSAERLYQTAVSLVVEALLGHCSPSHSACNHSGILNGEMGEVVASRVAELGGVTAGEVGRIYEYLRGFRLELSKDGSASIVPSMRGRRNQGLFYTPAPIVRHIVSRTLDALEIEDPSELLDVRILDPAVGTGLFLVEALDQLTQRVLSSQDRGLLQVARRVDEIQDQYREIFTECGIDPGHVSTLGVRAHLLERYLYGVDLDPVAIALARAALIEHTFRDLPVPPGIDPQIRVGNSLLGEARDESWCLCRAYADRKHAEAYFGTALPDMETIHAWSERLAVVHWPIQYPEIFSPERDGFDAVVGNPPYEIVSVQESGIEARKREQRYFRKIYETCSGKINTYRLMLERGLQLLRPGGVLGFIIPATLLADSSAAHLRRRVLEETQVKEVIVVPEKAKVFEGVTQALLILITRTGGRTEKLTPMFWNSEDYSGHTAGVEVTHRVIHQTGMRIPLLRSQEEKALLEALSQYPPFGGDRDLRAVAAVHQGEINLSVHRRFITSWQTAYPLIRGEHIEPLMVQHPSGRLGRWDWVDESFFAEEGMHGRSSRPTSDHRSRPNAKPRSPWEHERIALARVVNMATQRRLKAALLPSGCLLGDMTNFIANPMLPRNYLLGLLNSRLLNWRLKLTSTNNYVSAAEIEALPIPRIDLEASNDGQSRRASDQVRTLLASPSRSLPEFLITARAVMERSGQDDNPMMIALMIEALVDLILKSATKGEGNAQNLLDALVVKLYRVEPFAEVPLV